MNRILSFGFALAFSVVSTVANAVTVEEVTSPGGIKAYLVQDRTNPIIGLSFMFAGGSAIDPDAKLGLSSMAASLMDEGAADKDSFAFQSALQDRAISLGFSADRDAVRGSVSTTTQASAFAFDMLRDALMTPRFDDEPTERVRRQILIRLKAETENPNRMASRALTASMFPGHPYGRNDDGTPESVAAITKSDLTQWTRERFAKDRLIVAAVGDITPTQLGQALDQIFGALPATTGLADRVAEAKVSTRAQRIHIDRAQPQTVIVMAQPGIKRDDPDWYVAQILDYSFGSGSFAARLMDEVRKKRGLAYSVSSALQALDAAGLMTASAATRNDQAHQTRDVILAEWRKIQKDGITEQELNDAKLYLTGAWPLRFSSTGRIAETLVAMQRDNLGIDYLDKRNSYVNAVTLADTKRVAAKLYRPEQLTIVTVGPEADTKAKPSAPTERPVRERKS
jgi:zinc protease